MLKDYFYFLFFWANFVFNEITQVSFFPYLLVISILFYFLNWYLISCQMHHNNNFSFIIWYLLYNRPLGALGSVVGNPFDVLKTRMMTAEGMYRRVRAMCAEVYCGVMHSNLIVVWCDGVRYDTTLCSITLNYITWHVIT